MSGFNFNNTGDVSVDAGGDVVAGDKVTTTNTSTNNITNNYGFAQEEEKQQFLQKMDELRNYAKEINSRVDDLEGVDDDQKEALEDELTEQIKAIRQLKKVADQVEAGSEVAPGIASQIEKQVDFISNGLDKLNQLGEKSSNFMETVGNVLIKASPLLLSARHLFGIP
ncbi:MAG: hypothetical protein COB04_17455 [Gammaproteobacteria bacterium]|nr:MAG: hypothetical protein COB04_17455 [Gammaproteobacteria bacterium]